MKKAGEQVSDHQLAECEYYCKSGVKTRGDKGYTEFKTLMDKSCLGEFPPKSQPEKVKKPKATKPKRS